MLKRIESITTEIKEIYVEKDMELAAREIKLEKYQATVKELWNFLLNGASNKQYHSDTRGIYGYIIQVVEKIAEKYELDERVFYEDQESRIVG
jgi:hypothetical protein